MIATLCQILLICTCGTDSNDRFYKPVFKAAITKIVARHMELKLPEQSAIMAYLLSNLVSLILGIGSSFIAWWVLQHKMTAEIKFSEELAKYDVPSGGLIYLCALENSGRRSALDVEVIVRIGIKEFNGASGWAFFSVKTNASRIPVLEKRRRGIIRIFDQREQLQFLDSPSKGLRARVNECDDLEKILSLGAAASIEVHAFCYDKFSGTKCHFQSGTYTSRDIRRGRYNGLSVVQQNKKESSGISEIEL